MYKWLIILSVLLISKGVMAQNVQLKNADSLFQLQNWKAAADIYSTVLSDTSTNALELNRLGLCNYNLGRYATALKNYQQALANKPTAFLKSLDEERIARLHGKTNKPDSALKWLNIAATSGFSNVAELDTLSEFKTLSDKQTFKDVYQRIYALAYPCTTAPHTHDFDFWIGEWDVYQTGTHNLVGHSLVQSVSGGCSLLENWNATTANNGKSLNYYDVNANAWEQDWVGSGGGAQRYTNGEYKNGAMHFIYESISGGQKTIGNFLFYNIDKNTVRQYQDMSTDGGKTYTVAYDLTYIRK
jgi:tetratricopeptide (TPR) repeat protein